MRVLPDYPLVDHTSDRPIHLAGPPRRLSGKLRLRNPGTERVVVRSGRLSFGRGATRQDADQDAEKQTSAATSTTAVEINMTAILAPGQTVVIPIRASIDPHTRPGDYEANLAVGTHTYPIVLHVLEEIDVVASPTQVVVENEPGSRIQKRIHFTNNGNVPVTIGRVGALPLDDQLAVCRTIRSTLAEAADTAHSFEDWFTAYLREGRKHLARTGMIWVDSANGAITIEPGEAATVAFAIRIPDTLDPIARYSAVAFIYDTNIEFLITPTGTEKPRKPNGTAVADRPRPTTAAPETSRPTNVPTSAGRRRRRK